MNKDIIFKSFEKLVICMLLIVNIFNFFYASHRKHAKCFQWQIKTCPEKGKYV